MLLEQIQPRDAAGVVDDHAPGSVLVFGSLPGAGRDLDLLVRDQDIGALRAALDCEGFRSRDDEWVRFAGGTAEAVDLVPASTWRLPAAELDDLFHAALPIDGFARLVCPAPAQALLVLARLTGVRGALPEKRRRKLEPTLAGGSARVGGGAPPPRTCTAARWRSGCSGARQAERSSRRAGAAGGIRSWREPGPGPRSES